MGRGSTSPPRVGRGRGACRQACLHVRRVKGGCPRDAVLWRIPLTPTLSAEVGYIRLRPPSSDRTRVNPSSVASGGGTAPENRGAAVAPSNRRAHARRAPGTMDLRARGCYRSEEHTSELQSLRHLVCRLLLE